jgi:hypothetical protein
VNIPFEVLAKLSGNVQLVEFSEVVFTRQGLIATWVYERPIVFVCEEFVPDYCI